MESLRALIRELPSVLLGYSGGVDSALLAVVLRQELGRDRMLAAIGRSASYPDAQWQVARAVAARFDIPLVEIETHELEDGVMAPPRAARAGARTRSRVRWHERRRSARTPARQGRGSWRRCAIATR